MSENSERPIIILQPDMSPISIKDYAALKKMNINTVKSQCERGILPTIQVGKGRTIFINQALMVMRSLEAGGWDVQVPQPYMS